MLTHGLICLSITVETELVSKQSQSNYIQFL